MKKLFYLFSICCLLLTSCSDSSSSRKKENDDAILMEMLDEHQKRQELMSRIETSYNSYRRSLESGSATAYMGKAGLWKYKEEMENLCNEYIRLAKKLNDNKQVVEEAERQKRNIMSAFKDMGF